MSHSSAQTQTIHGYGAQAESTLPAEIEEEHAIRRFPWAAGLPAEMLADFTREATIVAQLRHPHIVQVHAAGKLADGTPHVVMERLRGRTLEEAMESGPVPAAELAPILRGIASALCAAHTAGVVHGGLRADTVFLAEMPGYRWGFPKLLDFGVARLGAAEPADAHADLRGLVALAMRAFGRPFPPEAQRVLDRATRWDAQLPFASVTLFMAALEQALAIASADAARVVDAARVADAVPVAANPPSSLTQQFFAEGERQDVVHAAEDDDLDADDAEASVVRVPRNRAQIATATAVAFSAVAIIVGTVVALSTARDVTPPAPVVIQRPADVPVATAGAPAKTRTDGARTPGEPLPVHRERPHQGRTATPRARPAEPPRFIQAPVPPAVAAPPAVPNPAPPAAPNPTPAPEAEASTPAAAAAPAAEASAPPAAAATAPEDTSSVVNDDEASAPAEQTEGEAPTTE